MKKSVNFDNNLDSTRMKKQIKTNFYKVANKTFSLSKKEVPISTGTTLKSFKLKTLSNNKIELSSINYSNTSWGHSNITRYEFTGSNEMYRIPKKAVANRGKIVPAGKNSNKAYWFRRGNEKNKTKSEDLKKGVIL